jgi:hypothetical protein
MPYCPKCGAEVVGDGSPCGYCGKKIGDIQTNNQDSSVLSEITDTDILDDKEKKDKYPIGGYISVVTSVIGLIMIIAFKSLGMIKSGVSEWSTSAIVLLFVSMAFASTGIMSGVVGLNHPKKLLSWIGFLLSLIFVGILASIIISQSS